MKSNEEVHKLVVGTFETPLGKKCLTHFKETLVNRPMYKKGLSLDEVAFREGQADVVRQIIKEIENV